MFFFLPVLCFSWSPMLINCSFPSLWILILFLKFQDADSSSMKSFRSVYPDENVSKVMKCAGHIGRAHGNQMTKYISMKELSKAMKDKHRRAFPEVDTVKCVCHGRNHSDTCGCIRPGHVSAAKRNLYCIMVQSGSPDEFASRMESLGKYHARDIHEWEGGK